MKKTVKKEESTQGRHATNKVPSDFQKKTIGAKRPSLVFVGFLLVSMVHLVIPQEMVQDDKLLRFLFQVFYCVSYVGSPNL